MSTTDPGPTSPTTVGSRPGGSEQRPQPDGSPRGSAPVRTTTAPPRPGSTGTGPKAPAEAPSDPDRPGQDPQAGQGGDARVLTGGNGRVLPPPAPGQARPARPGPGQARTTGQPPGQPQPRPGQPRPAQARPGQPTQPGQPRPGQPRPGQPRPGQARGPRPGQPVPGRGGRPGVQRGPRKARLSLARLDPWSVLKLSFLLSVALGIVGVVVTAVVWNVVNGMGVFADINSVVGQVQGDTADFDITDFVGFERVLSLSVVISVVNVAIITALSTLFAFVYNISSGLVGGLHVTLTDE